MPIKILFRITYTDCNWVAVEGICQKKECSDLFNFIPKEDWKKSVSDGDGCTLADKECHELEYNQCHNYEVPEDLEEKEVICVEKDDHSRCELVGCYYLRSDQCSTYKTYKFIQEPKLCVSDGKGGCEIKRCAFTEKGNCDKFNENILSRVWNKCIEPQMKMNQIAKR